MATITVGTTTYQTIKGWEATSQGGQLEYPVTWPNYEADVLAAALDLGLNRIRVEILSGIVENSSDYYQLFLDSNADVVDNTNPTSWANFRTNRRIPVNDNGDPNSINASGFKWAYLDRQITTVVEPLIASLAAQGETLEWHICYVHFSASDQLHIDTAAEYGELMLAVWQHCNTTFGMTPTGLEIFLEPDNTAAATSAEIAAMINAAYDRITGGGFAAPYIVAPTTTTSPACLGYYQGVKTASAVAGGRISEVSRHRYGTQPDDTTLIALRTEVEADGKFSSMLESGAGVASNGNAIDGLLKDLEVGRVSAWQQFTIAYRSLGGTITDDANQYFLIGDSPGFDVTMCTRTKYIRHVTKYVRAGAVMKSVTNSDSNYKGYVFENANGTIVVVGKCTTSGAIDVVSLPAGTYQIRYTLGNGVANPSAYDQALSNQTISGGQNVSFTMPGEGVFTVFDTNYITPVPVITGGRGARRLLFG